MIRRGGELFTTGLSRKRNDEGKSVGKKNLQRLQNCEAKRKTLCYLQKPKT